MIGKLKGILDKILETQIVLDVNGVGYLVAVSSSTIAKLGEPGSSATLLIETFVREDAINLYGFASEEEKYWFMQLNKVTGVGPKVALAILSSIKPNELIIALSSGDKKLISSVPGIGPKLAERIITELKSVAAKAGFTTTSAEIVNIKNFAKDDNSNVIQDAALALEKLGFGRSDAFSVVSNIFSKNKESKLEDLIKSGLKELAGSR